MTNGINETVVVPRLAARLGWLNPTEGRYGKVDCDNQKTVSGRCFNDDSIHPIVTIQNLYDCQADPHISDSAFNKYLVQLRKSNVISMLTQVFDRPQFIGSGFVYERPEHTVLTPIANSGRWAGIRIQITKGDYGVHLQNAVLLFNGAATFNLYLYHSMTDGKDTVNDVENVDVKYIKKWAVTTKANKQVNVELDYYINYSNSDFKGGAWFLCYKQDDLGDVKALDFSACRNCYTGMQALSFLSDADGEDDFNRDVYPTSSQMYGLNIELGVYNDLSNLIINNAPQFDYLQGLLMAARTIEIIYNSTQSNVKQRVGKENLAILYRDLNQVTTVENPMSPGLKSQIMKEMGRLRKMFNKQPAQQNVDL